MGKIKTEIKKIKNIYLIKKEHIYTFLIDSFSFIKNKEISRIFGFSVSALFSLSVISANYLYYDLNINNQTNTNKTIDNVTLSVDGTEEFNSPLKIEDLEFSKRVISLSSQYKDTLINDIGEYIGSIGYETKIKYNDIIDDVLLRIYTSDTANSLASDIYVSKILAIKNFVNSNIESSKMESLPNDDEKLYKQFEQSLSFDGYDTNLYGNIVFLGSEVFSGGDKLLSSEESAKISNSNSSDIKQDKSLSIDTNPLKVEQKKEDINYEVVKLEDVPKLVKQEESSNVAIVPTKKEEPKVEIKYEPVEVEDIPKIIKQVDSSISIKTSVLKDELKVDINGKKENTQNLVDKEQQSNIVISPPEKEEPKIDVIDNGVKVITQKVVLNTSSDSLQGGLDKEIANQLNKLNNNVFNGFKVKILKNDNLVLENGVWYTYVFSNYKNFGKGVNPSLTDLKSNGIDYDSTVLILDDSMGASFVMEYKKIKLVNDSLITGISNKKQFLKELADDKKYLSDDTDDLFSDLKSETNKLVNGLSKSQKIQKIYDYILKNISYSKVFDVNNKYIFSGIYTYKNKDGICSGYAKLYLYMLSFAGVDDVSVLRGNVIDAADFPNIGHAWVKIGNNYYDPTFDDVGISTKKFSQYNYYGLPKDLFYTNRFDYGDLPGYLKTASLNERRKYIDSELGKLVDKYELNNYNLLKKYEFKKQYGIEYTKKINISDLENIIPFYEVNNSKYIYNNTEKTINNLDYYTITDSNLESILNQINYVIDGFKLFKWDNGTYRLAYNVT